MKIFNLAAGETVWTISEPVVERTDSGYDTGTKNMCGHLGESTPVSENSMREFSPIFRMSGKGNYLSGKGCYLNCIYE